MEAGFALGSFALPALAVLTVVAVIGFGVFTSLVKLSSSPRPPPLLSNLSDVSEDRGKKRKTKEKKTSPGRTTGETETKSKKNPDSNKKSPLKEKNRDHSEKKPKEKNVEPKSTEKTPKKENRKPAKEVIIKPDDYDEGDWEKVPSKSDKKGRKKEEEKKDSPITLKKKDSPVANKKKGSPLTDKKGDSPIADKIKDSPVADKKDSPIADRKDSPVIDNSKEVPPTDELHKQIAMMEQALMERVSKPQNESPVSSVPATPEMKNKTKAEVEALPQKSQKKVIKQSSEDSDEPDISVPIVENDDVEENTTDTWTDAKVPKKGKKKPRKE